ncbi:hypothetical protein CPB84DRAFT_1304620 [Gymnopilus junonius]|uniref:Uncharacterized protein n=1 Tax=Gymnopilus junonius TaxID=109634 RepID=A0A9P5NJV3_GYMJU|nr:hypothetical protein CPB84DRAFT_1304620 [Gymnopilus junonius]
MSASLLSSSIEEAAIDVSINSQLLDNFFMGVYTVVYFSTLYIYGTSLLSCDIALKSLDHLSTVTKQSNKSWIVIGSMSLSYLAFVIANSVQWYLTKLAFVDNGTSREAIFDTIFFGTYWGFFLNNVCMFVIFVLADSLLIWRCYNVWNRSIRSVIFPSLLLFFEIGLDLSVVIIEAVVDLNPPPNLANVINMLTGASLFTTFATSTVAAVLISYRIYFTAKQNSALLGSRSQIRYHHILEVLLQSAAAYSLITLAYAIVSVYPSNINNITIITAVNGYLAPFYFFIAVQSSPGQ